jgi:hypothetical protein
MWFVDSWCFPRAAFTQKRSTFGMLAGPQASTLQFQFTDIGASHWQLKRYTNFPRLRKGA